MDYPFDRGKIVRVMAANVQLKEIGRWVLFHLV